MNLNNNFLYVSAVKDKASHLTLVRVSNKNNLNFIAMTFYGLSNAC